MLISVDTGQRNYRTLGRYSMGGGGGVIGVVIGAVVTAIGVFVPGAQALIPMGITMMASSVISAVTAPKPPSYDQNSTQQLNTGSNIQIQPATTNKLPVVYGTTFIGGTITDLSITTDNQNLYYVLSLCEVTGNGSDVIQFGDIYYGGKKVILDGTTVTGLLDVSTGVTDTTVNGLINIYLYNDGSFSQRIRHKAQYPLCSLADCHTLGTITS